MIKRFSCILFCLMFLSIVGCATIEGAGKGFAQDTKGIGSSIWTGIEKADAWVKEHLW